MWRSILVLAVFACCGFRAPQDAQPSAEKLVIKAAESQLNMFLAKIPPGQESEYGFDEKDNLEACEIGKPYRIMVFNDDFYSDEIDNDISYLEFRNEWLAPVRLTGQDRVLLTVAGAQGNLHVTDIGGSDLAKELRSKTMISDKEDEFYLLKVTPLNAEFFVTVHESSLIDAKFFPLTSAVTAMPSLGKAKKTYYTLSEIQPMVKEAVNKLETTKKPSKKVTPVKNKSKKIKLQQDNEKKK